MPFKSQAQMKAAFAGKLGPRMQAAAQEWADATPNIATLPERIKPKAPRLKKLR